MYERRRRGDGGKASNHDDDDDQYNSGIGSNGLTSARHDVLNQEMARKYPETYDPAIPSSLIYSGK